MMTHQPYIPWSGWTIESVLGQGSFGTVYEIRRDLFGDTERAAMKVISIPKQEEEIRSLQFEGLDNESISKTFYERLETVVREYRTMMHLRGHSNIVQCSDVQYFRQSNGFGWDIYIKMELLTPLMRAPHTVQTEAQIVQLGIDMCSALVKCQSQNVIHRDIKPQNIFVSPDGSFKLGDFGIAKSADHIAYGTVTGTYKYMAPEVYARQPYGMAADIYSLGLVLYWLLNQRRLPFMPLNTPVPTAAEEEYALQLRFSGNPPPPPVYGSPGLKQIVLTACAPNPYHRFSNAAAMLQALQTLQNTGGYYDRYGSTTVLSGGNYGMNDGSFRGSAYPSGSHSGRPGSMGSGGSGRYWVPPVADSGSGDIPLPKPKKMGIIPKILIIAALIAIGFLAVKFRSQIPQLLPRIREFVTQTEDSAPTGLHSRMILFQSE